jgi:hypothetical protein
MKPLGNISRLRGGAKFAYDISVTAGARREASAFRGCADSLNLCNLAFSFCRLLIPVIKSLLSAQSHRLVMITK